MERRTSYPGIYEYAARGGRRRYQVVFRTGGAIDASPQRAASFDTLKDTRDYQISQSHRVREGTYFDPKKGEITLARVLPRVHASGRTRGGEVEDELRGELPEPRGAGAGLAGDPRRRRGSAGRAAGGGSSEAAPLERRQQGHGQAGPRPRPADLQCGGEARRLPRYFPNPAAAIDRSTLR